MTKRQKRSLPRARPPLTKARHSILLIEPGPFPSSTLTRLRRIERRSLILVPIERPAKQKTAFGRSSLKATPRLFVLICVFYRFLIDRFFDPFINLRRSYHSFRQVGIERTGIYTSRVAQSRFGKILSVNLASKCTGVSGIGSPIPRCRIARQFKRNVPSIFRCNRAVPFFGGHRKQSV